LDKARREVAARGLFTRVHDFNADVPIHRFLNHHTAKLTATKNT